MMGESDGDGWKALIPILLGVNYTAYKVLEFT